jgi:amino acid permease
MFSVIIQMCVLPMYEELEERSPQAFQKIVNISFAFLFLFMSLFSTVGYLLYGEVGRRDLGGSLEGPFHHSTFTILLSPFYY